MRLDAKLTCALLLAAAAALCGCTPHTTNTTEVGVKFNKLTGSLESLPAGATYFFPPVINDWKTYDLSVQNLTMTADAASGDREGKDDLRFKTRDGNDIETDVTVRWRIDQGKAPYLWKYVGPGTEEVGARLVRPM